MKAIVYTKYGSPDVLELKEVEKPSPKNNEVLIKVHATTVTPMDWKFRNGKTLIARFMIGLLKPKTNILGVEFAGEIEAVGKDVRLWRRTSRRSRRVCIYARRKSGHEADQYDL